MCSINQTQTYRSMKQLEKCTKRTRKGHGSGTVFTTAEFTTPTPTRTCAAGRNIVFRARNQTSSELRNEPKRRPVQDAG
jgi:hypothetical protein